MNGSFIDQISTVDEPIHGLDLTYRRQKRWSEFIPDAVRDIRAYLESNPDAFNIGTEFDPEERIDDYLYQLVLDNEAFRISSNLEIAYVLKARDMASDITFSVRDIVNNTNNRNDVGFSLTDLENSLLNELRATNKKLFNTEIGA